MPDRDIAPPLPADLPDPAVPRHVAPGGWRRALVGLAVGALAGAAAAAVLPREDGPRRQREPR